MTTRRASQATSHAKRAENHKSGAAPSRSTSSPKKEPLIDRLTTQARILYAAVELQDGRSGHARSLRKTADLMTEAVMFIAGIEAGKRRR